MDERPIHGAKVVTPGDTTVIGAGRRFAINCSVAGNVTIRFNDNSTHVISAVVGYNDYRYAVIGVNTTGTTATAVYSNLY